VTHRNVLRAAGVAITFAIGCTVYDPSLIDGAAGAGGVSDASAAGAHASGATAGGAAGALASGGAGLADHGGSAQTGGEAGAMGEGGSALAGRASEASSSGAGTAGAGIVGVIGGSSGTQGHGGSPGASGSAGSAMGGRAGVGGASAGAAGNAGSAGTGGASAGSGGASAGSGGASAGSGGASAGSGGASAGSGGASAGSGGASAGSGGSAGASGSVGVSGGAGAGGSAGGGVVIANGCANLGVPLVAATKARFVITLGSAMNFSSATITMRVYVKAGAGGVISNYVQDSDYDLLPNLAPTKLNTLSGWQTLTWNVGAQGPGSTAITLSDVSRIGIEINAGSDPAWSNPTLVYVDSIKVSSPTLSFLFDASSSVSPTPSKNDAPGQALWPNAYTEDTTTGTVTLGWLASCP